MGALVKMGSLDNLFLGNEKGLHKNHGISRRRIMRNTVKRYDWKKRVFSIPIALILIFSAFTFITFNTQAQNSPVVYIDPAVTILNQGDSFCIDIYVDSDGTPVRTIGLDLYYPSPGFAVDSMTYNGLLGSPGTVIPIQNDDGAGKITIALTRIGGTGNLPTVVNGVLYTICFTVTGYIGTYILDLDDVTLIDGTGSAIPGVVVNDATVMVTSVVDDILITFDSHNEIPDQPLSTNFTLDCYAAGFSDTYGFIGFVDANWGIVTNDGSNASINSSSGKSIELFSGWYNGNVTLTAQMVGEPYVDSVTFAIDQDIFSMMIGQGWNLIGWSHDDPTDAETLGQYISGCTLVLMFDYSQQEFVTHVAGNPYDNFMISRSMGLFIRASSDSIWDGTDGTV
jgi:hypothetical protein